MINASCQFGPQLNCGLKPCGLGWFGLPYNMVTKLQEQPCQRSNVHGLLSSLGSHRASLPSLVKAATEFCPRSIDCQGHRLHHGMRECQGHCVRRACGMGDFVVIILGKDDLTLCSVRKPSRRLSLIVTSPSCTCEQRERILLALPLPPPQHLAPRLVFRRG